MKQERKQREDFLGWGQASRSSRKFKRDSLGDESFKKCPVPGKASVSRKAPEKKAKKKTMMLEAQHVWRNSTLGPKNTVEELTDQIASRRAGGKRRRGAGII